jgi:hypothetical protein
VFHTQVGWPLDASNTEQHVEAIQQLLSSLTSGAMPSSVFDLTSRMQSHLWTVVTAIHGSSDQSATHAETMSAPRPAKASKSSKAAASKASSSSSEPPGSFSQALTDGEPLLRRWLTEDWSNANALVAKALSMLAQEQCGILSAKLKSDVKYEQTQIQIHSLKCVESIIQYL